MAPSPVSDASVCMRKGRLKSGFCRTGLLVKASCARSTAPGLAGLSWWDLRGEALEESVETDDNPPTPKMHVTMGVG